MQAKDEVAGLCSDLLKLDTTNFGGGEAKGEREAAEYIAAKLAEVGIASQLYESAPRRATLVAEWAPPGTDTSATPLLVHGHTDVVPAIADDWSTDPFAAEEADGYLWGRGAVDMKDFDAIILAVVRERASAGRPPRRPIRLVFTADEENGGRFGSHWLVDNHPELVADCPEAIGEVGGFSLTVNGQRLYLIQTAEKGIAWLKLIAEGQAGHGSLRNSDNALTHLAQAVARIGEYSWPSRITSTQRQFLAALEELGVHVDPDDPQAALSALGSIGRMTAAAMSNTANPTRLDAGYTVNVIPSQASAGIDGRFIPGCEGEFYATVQELLGRHVRYERINADVAVETEFEGHLVDAMRASLAAADPEGIPVPYLTSVGTDAKAWSRLGIRCFGFAPLRLPPSLDFAALFHGVDERVPLSALEFGVEVFDSFLQIA
ncbi:MAG: M20/M25/M40 family metallo-hydrolase [Propionibacteriaceae bacterium]|jgi:acetylornithine deacetylase/succinyl-diaminopimelate desuccinylase-like protein|nr:M20/M25/M40 family metallo-hydrolase [Propionibacteriaceae bacterium]